MSRVYTIQFNGVAVSAQQDFFEVVAASTKAVQLLEVHLSQTTELGDAQEEALLVLVKSGQTVSGSGGSSPTAVPLELGDAAFAGSCEVNNTTKANTGTIVTHFAWAWNIRVPLDIIFTPECVKTLAPSARMTVELGTTPADSITMSGYIVVRELG